MGGPALPRELDGVGIAPNAVERAIEDLTRSGYRPLHARLAPPERSYGAFQRTFELPEDVDVAHVEAKYSNRMLEVRIPAPQVTTRRLIEVKAA